MPKALDAFFKIQDFVKNGEGYIHIKAGIDRNDVKNFTDVSYTNKSDDIHNKPIEEAFVKDDIGGNLLHSYVYENKEAVMKHMFNLHIYNDDSINAVNANGKTPLHLAAKYGRKGMIEMLLDKGAGVDVVDSRGRTPLHWAAQNNNKEIVDALIKAKATVDIKDEDEKTPLDLTTNEEIKTLLKAAENPGDGSVDKPSTDNEENSEKDAGTRQKEKQEGDAQPEEQPSSFFDSLFSILMKPFSLIGSFLGGFFSWLFGSNTDESTSQTDASVSLLKSDSLDEEDSSGGHYSAMNTDV